VAFGALSLGAMADIWGLGPAMIVAGGAGAVVMGWLALRAP
jgi:hypothetical protein